MAWVSTRITNWAAALTACKRTREILKKGAGNKPFNAMLGLGFPILCVSQARGMADRIEKYQVAKSPKEARIQAVHEAASFWQCGNCGEHAAVAFILLRDMGVRPIDLMERQKKDHGFVVIGRSPQSPATKPMDWGQAAIVCDAYYDEVYWASLINLKMSGTVQPKSVFRLD